MRVFFGVRRMSLRNFLKKKIEDGKRQVEIGWELAQVEGVKSVPGVVELYSKWSFWVGLLVLLVCLWKAWWVPALIVCATLHIQFLFRELWWKIDDVVYYMARTDDNFERIQRHLDDESLKIEVVKK